MTDGVPGAFAFGVGDLEINEDRPEKTIVIVNTGDRPVQIGSHFHLPDVNSALSFERIATIGYRVNVPSGTSIRFEPGVSRRVGIIKMGGTGTIRGLQAQHKGRDGQR